MNAVPNPYITGSWVSGPEHYGRKELADTLLRGGSRAYWLTGSRRSGKTSLLRQLEWLARRRGRSIALYWDLGGCTTPGALGLRLGEAVQDALPQLEPLGIPSTLPADTDALALITQLRRLLLRKGRELLLLCDDGDAFAALAQAESEFMARLHREFHGAGLRTVIVSSRAALLLHDICAGWAGPSFLSGFEMSQTLGVLDASSARALILRSQAPRAQRMKVPSAIIAALRDATGSHPYLLQKLCARMWEGDAALRMPDGADLYSDAEMRGCFEQDWRLLSPSERSVLLAVCGGCRATPLDLQRQLGIVPAVLRASLGSLSSQGALRQLGASYAVGNAFLEQWLAAEHTRLAQLPPPHASAVHAQAARAGQDDQGLGALAEQLNVRRARLVELELVRAKDFHLTSPPVLAEIAQLEIEIAALRSLVVRRASA